MIYVKDQGVSAKLAGTVATPEMLADGWVPYYGPVPEGNVFRLEDGVLVAIDSEYAETVIEGE